MIGPKPGSARAGRGFRPLKRDPDRDPCWRCSFVRTVHGAHSRNHNLWRKYVCTTSKAWVLALLVDRTPHPARPVTPSVVRRAGFAMAQGTVELRAWPCALPRTPAPGRQ